MVDWYERQHELEPEQVFRMHDGEPYVAVRLTGPLPADAWAELDRVAAERAGSGVSALLCLLGLHRWRPRHQAYWVQRCQRCGKERA